MSGYDFVEGDNSVIQFKAKDQDGKVIILTDATVLLKWHDSAGALVTKSMTIDDAINGIISYKFTSSELFAPEMYFEVHITDVGGNEFRSTNLITRSVRKKAA